MKMTRDLEAAIGAWIDEGPAVLPNETRQAIALAIRTGAQRRQGIAWRLGFGRPNLPWSPSASPIAAALSAIALVVIGTVVVVNPRPGPVSQVAAPRLPSSLADWARVVIDDAVEGAVVSLAATPRGLIAGVGEGDQSQLYFSADGRTWSELPADGLPPLGNPSLGVDGAAVVGDEQRMLMIGHEVLASEDGLDWHAIASGTNDDALDLGVVAAAAATGPGLVAVGTDNKAWYSTDGSEWALAGVPAPPAQPSLLKRPLGPREHQGLVEMQGIAIADGTLLAWGKAIWVHDDQSRTFVPVFWTSNDGTTWTRRHPRSGSGHIRRLPAALTASSSPWRTDPCGYPPTVRHGRAPAVMPWDASHGRRGVRERGHQRQGGYVAAGLDGICLLPCASEEAAIWTSPDGRSWTRLPSDDLLGGTASGQRAEAWVAAPWGDGFVVGGLHGSNPAVWVSRSDEPTAHVEGTSPG